MVNRSETKGMWWHRLERVLLLGSVILIGLLIIATTTASLLDKYNISPFEDSEDVQVLNLREVLDYAKKNPSDPRNVELYRNLKIGTFDNQAFEEGIDLSSLGRPSLKEMTISFYKTLFLDLFFAVLSVIITVAVWFVFWESVFYRTIIYIIYGSKK